MSSFPTEPPTLRSFSTATTLNRRSYSCYNCNYSFFITPTTDSPPPSSFRCPRCLQRHLIPHHTVLRPPSPPPPETDYISDDFEFENEEEEDDYDTNSQFLLQDYRITPSALKALVDSLSEKSLPLKSTEPVESCPICLDDFDSKCCEIVVELKCKHCYHKKCIGEWFKRSNTCPVCRYKIELSTKPKWDFRDEVFSDILELEFQLDQGGMSYPVRDPMMRRVNAEASLNAIAEAAASGSDWRVLSTNGGVRSRFNTMHDEDGDTMMVALDNANN